MKITDYLHSNFFNPQDFLTIMKIMKLEGVTFKYNTTLVPQNVKLC